MTKLSQEEIEKVRINATRMMKLHIFFAGWCWCVVFYLGANLLVVLEYGDYFAAGANLLMFALNAWAGSYNWREATRRMRVVFIDDNGKEIKGT